MTGIRVAASLWSVPRADLEREATRLAAAGLRSWHWDRADGSMGAAGGFTAAEALSLAELSGLSSEAHLMLANPLDELDEWLAFCDRVVVHLESHDVEVALTRTVAAGRRAAVAYSPGWPLGGHPPHADADALVMSVIPGHGGGAFLPGSLERIAELAARYPSVGVDGGVTASLAADAITAGATWIVSGTALLADPRAFLALQS